MVNEAIDWLKWLNVFERKCLSVHHVAIVVALNVTLLPINKPASQQNRLTKYSLQVNRAGRIDT